MSAFEKGSVQIPLIQPSKGIVIEVATYLKNNLSPLQWRHSHATIGALHLHEWHKGNAYLLQQCCLHGSIKMTEKYINQKGAELLKAFES